MSRTLFSCLLLPVMLLLGITIISCGSNPVDAVSNTIIAGESRAVATSSVSSSGGIVVVNAPGDSLDGMEVNVPTGAYSDSRTFRISAAPIQSHQLGSNCNPVTPLITIENGGGYADEFMTLTIPISVPDNHFAMAFLYDDVTGEMEGLPMLESTSNHVKILTANFAHSDIAALKRGVAGLSANSGPSRSRIFVSSIEKNVLEAANESTFRPGVDDWQFVNYGSYAAPGGHCAGQSLAAMWYHNKKRINGRLYGRYDNDGTRKTPTIWQDDVGGYKFCSVLQKDMAWNSISRKLLDGVQTLIPDFITYYASSYTFLLLHRPQFIAISNDTSAHAIIGYAIGDGNIYVSDPNYPADRTRKIPYVNGKFGTYFSGSNAAKTGTPFPTTRFIGESALINYSTIEARWGEVASGTIGGHLFPTYTLKGMNDAGTFVPLTDGFSIKGNTLNFDISSITSLKIAAVFDESERALPIINEAVQLPQGTQRIGFYITDRNGTWFGFTWVQIRVEGTNNPPPPPPATGLSFNGGPYSIGILEHTIDSGFAITFYPGFDVLTLFMVGVQPFTGVGTYTVTKGDSYVIYRDLRGATPRFNFQTDEQHTAKVEITQFDDDIIVGKATGSMKDLVTLEVRTFTFVFRIQR